MAEGPFVSLPLPWIDSFSVGIEALDADHRALVQLINEVCSHVRAGCREAAAETLRSLYALAAEHFKREEAVLSELSGCRHLTEHAGEHRNRLKQLATLRQRYENTMDSAPVEWICDDLIHWFVHQSIGHDAEIKSFQDARGLRFSSLCGNRG